MHATSFTIGIDARAAAEVPAGRGRVVRELIRALAARPQDPHRYVLYARKAWDGAELDERFAWRQIAARDPWWHLLTARAANRECDVFLSSNSYLTVWFLVPEAKSWAWLKSTGSQARLQGYWGPLEIPAKRPARSISRRS